MGWKRDITLNSYDALQSIITFIIYEKNTEEKLQLQNCKIKLVSYNLQKSLTVLRDCYYYAFFVLKTGTGLTVSV